MEGHDEEIPPVGASEPDSEPRCGKRKEPEPDSDDTEKEGQGQAKKKVMTIYDCFVPYAYGPHTIEQSDRFDCYEFQQMTSCSKYNWFQR